MVAPKYIISNVCSRVKNSCRWSLRFIGRKGSINNLLYVYEPFWNVDMVFGLEAKEKY